MLVGLFILGSLGFEHKKDPTCFPQSTSEVHAVCSADAFNSQELSSGHLWSSMLVAVAWGIMAKIPEKPPLIPWDSKGMSVNERRTWKRLHLGKMSGDFYITISVPGHTHTQSHTLTSTHTYATGMVRWRPRAMWRIWAWYKNGSLVYPYPRIQIACLSPAVSISRNGSCLFICIPHILHRPGHMVNFQYKFIERLNKQIKG